jgi:nicotinamide-nucleotide amidase
MGADAERTQAGFELGPLLELATRVGKRLRERGETVAVAESSAGGLVSAALLAVPGASAFFQGGAVVYTRAAKERLLGLGEAELADPRAATEGHALVLAQAARRSLSADWGLGETGAAGPTGNRYGDPAGHACVAVVGSGERATTVRTGRDNREVNMVAFAEAALGLLLEALPVD